ncbi:hypothetical protein ACFQH3_16450 [Haladaptatus sp. GCM10025707]|uniref:hypothetical protein n=1 Tax=unclassified Haladaptatus TaxID=2622732 RepID=UPI00360933B5
MNDQTAVNTVEEYCMFGEERVYLFMAIARQKENPHLTSSTEVTFREVVTDTQDIRRKFDQLQSWAQHYRTESGDPLAFRLYLSVNARNTVDGFFNFQEQTNGWIRAWLKGDETAPGSSSACPVTGNLNSRNLLRATTHDSSSTWTIPQRRMHNACSHLWRNRRRS